MSMSDDATGQRDVASGQASENQQPNEGRGAVWFFSGDLLFGSRVQSAAQRAGRPFMLMGKWPDTWTADPQWIIVDLTTRSGASAEIRQQAVAKTPAARTIAYGAHVQPGRLAKAREDGFGSVLTRGQFDAALPTLFRE
jgi:hypothetical protein